MVGRIKSATYGCSLLTSGLITLNPSTFNPEIPLFEPHLCLRPSPRRDPSSLTNGKKKDTATEDPTTEQDNGKPKATRNILLIRHSQYNLSGSSDRERILTPLGPRPLRCDACLPADDPDTLTNLCASPSRSRAGGADGQTFGSVGAQIRHPGALQHDQGHGNGKYHQQTPAR